MKSSRAARHSEAMELLGMVASEATVTVPLTGQTPMVGQLMVGTAVHLHPTLQEPS